MRLISRSLFFVLGVFFLGSFTTAHVHAAPAATLLSPQVAFSQAGCDLIDNNWKEYGQRILNANYKVSDVVLNACAAIGGGCRFTSGLRCLDVPSRPASCPINKGASRSQHLLGAAIDLVVPEGKERQFITYAICGLRRVNDCQGGIGFYTNGSIHVDVRNARTNAWSTGYSRDDIVKIKDAEVRKILRDFDADKCTEGLFEDYTETEVYGPPVTEETPIPRARPDVDIPDQTQEWREAFGTGARTSEAVLATYTSPNQGVVIGQSVSSSIFSTTPNAFNQANPIRPETVTYESIFTPPQQTQEPSEDRLNDFFSLDDFFQQDEVSLDEPVPTLGSPNEVRCEDAGVFGITLFQSCEQVDPEVVQFTPTGESATAREPRVAVQQTQSLVSQGGGTGTQTTPLFIDTPLGVGATSGTPDSIQEAVIAARATNVFYGVHTPDDAVPQTVEETPVTFFSGEIPDTPAPQTPDVLTTSAEAARTSTLVGSYVGLVHGLAPTVLGGVPRTLWVLGSGALMRAQ